MTMPATFVTFRANFELNHIQKETTTVNQCKEAIFALTILYNLNKAQSSNPLLKKRIETIHAYLEYRSPQMDDDEVALFKKGIKDSIKGKIDQIRLKFPNEQNLAIAEVMM